MVKQVIVVRKDLNMRKGKIAAQVAHASMKVWFDRMIAGFGIDDSTDSPTEYTINLESGLTPEMIEWKEDLFTKIVVGCDGEEHLHLIAKKCELENIPYALIQDAGLTEFHGIPTYTCIAVGPADSGDIDKITGGFKLL